MWLRLALLSSLFIGYSEQQVPCGTHGDCQSDITVGVSVADTEQECRTHCTEIEECNFYTFCFDESLCYSHNDCGDLGDSLCVSGEISQCAADNCSLLGECQGHLIKATSVLSDDQCIVYCKEVGGCNFWTFDSRNSLCMLYTDCDTLNEDFTWCISGDSSCQAKTPNLLMVVGGTSSTGTGLSSVELIDLSETGLNCSLVHSYPSAASGPSGASIGLASIPLVCADNKCYSYDVETDEWELFVTMTRERNRDVRVAKKGSMIPLAYGELGAWITGGTADDIDTNTGVNTTELLLNEGFSEVSGIDLPYRTFRHCFVKVNATHAALVGGRENNEASVKFHMVNLENGDWTRLPDMAAPRENHFCGVSRNPDDSGWQVVVGGGRGVGRVTEIFDFTTHAWDYGPLLPPELGSLEGAAAVQFGSTFVFVGGVSDAGYQPTVYEYDSATNLWLLHTRYLTEARSGHAGVMLDDPEFKYCSYV